MSFKSDCKESSEYYCLSGIINNIEIHDKKNGLDKYVEVLDIERCSFFMKNNLVRRVIEVKEYTNKQGETIRAAYNEYSKILHLFLN